MELIELDKARDKAAVFALQHHLSTVPQYVPVTNNYFHGGMLCREVFRPAGVCIVGKVHKKEHFYVVASGTVLVTTEDGAKRITGPCVVMSVPGTKRAVYAETDAVCMTFHRTDSVSLNEAEKELIEDDPTALFDARNQLKELPL